MKNNNEIKIALVIGAIMLTICFVVIISNNSVKNNAQSATEIKVYKHYDDGETKEYRECQITTDELININNEFNNIKSLTEEDKYPGYTINGTYRITKGDDYIAFDGDTNLVYRGDTEAIYVYDSNLYEYVVDLCS